MLTGLFRSNQPAVLLTALVLVPLLFAGAFSGAPVPEGVHMVLFQVLLDKAGASVPVQGGIAIGLVLILTLQLASLVNNTEQTDRRNHLVVFLFPVLFALFHRSVLLDPALAGMPLVIWAMRRAWSITNVGPALGPLFDAGLLLGLAALVYLPYTFLVVVVWASVSVIRPFQWREYLMPALGAAVVFYLAWGVLHLNGLTPWRPLLTVADTRLPALEAAPWAWRWLRAGVLVPVLLAALYEFTVSYQRGVMQVKNLRSSFLALGAALSVVVGGVYALNNAFPPVLLAVPVSVVAVHGFLGNRRMALRELALWVLLALALWAQWT